jgi:calcium binding protein 39
MVGQYLCANFKLFFTMYHEKLLQSKSYVTKRQSIKLLGEILLERANYPVMTAYINNDKYLVPCMYLLQDERKMIKYEAFHVFKVFVANPKPSIEVNNKLFQNKEKLLRFLPRFLEDRTEDDQFTDEKSYCLKIIKELKYKVKEKESPPPTNERVPSLSVGA